MNTSPAIVVDKVAFRYSGSPDEVLNISHWQLGRGERIFLHGASGSGKSTFLNLLSGILLPVKGTIEILGKPFSASSAAARDRFRANHLGVIFQQFNLVPYLSVRENVELAQSFASHANNSFSIDELFTRLGLAHHIMDNRADQVSIGQQQRIAIARALINNPEIIIADEPTSALDDFATAEFMSLLIDSCQSANTALLFVSHDKRLARYFDQQQEMESLNRLAHEAGSGAGDIR